MAKRLLRKIVVDGETYLWYRAHSHLATYEKSPCVETLTVFPERGRKNRLRIRFREEDNKYRTGGAGWWHAGDGSSGVLWFYQRERTARVELNLNRPRVVAALIHRIRATQWSPTTGRLDIEDGLRLLDEYGPALWEQIEVFDLREAGLVGSVDDVPVRLVHTDDA